MKVLLKYVSSSRIITDKKELIELHKKNKIIIVKYN